MIYLVYFFVEKQMFNILLLFLFFIYLKHWRFLYWPTIFIFAVIIAATAWLYDAVAAYLYVADALYIYLAVSLTFAGNNGKQVRDFHYS